METVKLFYDKRGRLLHDQITTLGAGVDGAVRRISYSYHVRGMIRSLTNWSSPTVGQGAVVNEIQFEDNSFSQLVKEYQSHSGAVNTGSTPKVEYGYADGSGGTVRLTSMTYPDSRVLNYGYGPEDGMDDRLSRIQSLIDSDGTHGRVAAKTSSAYVAERFDAQIYW